MKKLLTLLQKPQLEFFGIFSKRMFDINAYFKNSVLITCALLVTPVIQAETAEDKGLAIAKEFDQRDLGFSDLTVEMTMTLRNKQGDETSRLI